MEEDSNYMPNKVFFDKGCSGDYNNPLQKIIKTKNYGNCVKPTDQSEKVLIGKHIAFSVEESVL